MQKPLALAFAATLVTVLIGCGGGGGDGPFVPPPPPPPNTYGGTGQVIEENCDFAVATITTGYTSSSSARNAALQRCETEATRQAAGNPRGRTCGSGFFSECAAIAAGNDASRRCRISSRYRSTLSLARSAAVEGCLSPLGSGRACRVIASGCASGSAPPAGVWRPSQGPPPPPPPPTLPGEPPRRSRPQESGSDWPGLEVAGAGTTSYVSALNTSSGAVVYRAGTWFEPKDGSYQRMIVTQSTTVPTGRVVRIPTACMQRSNPAPASGARFYSRPKSASSAVQQCQLNCLSGGGGVQSCVWNCEHSSPPPPPPPPPARPEIVFHTNDACNDGRDVVMRFSYYQGSQFINWATGTLVAGGSNTVTEVNCNFSNVDQVCYGARVDLGGGRYSYWGHDIDRSEGCTTNCCYSCPTSGQRNVTLNFGCP